MKRDSENQPASQAVPLPPDASSEIRNFASWMGLVMVALGVAMAGYLFYRIGMVLLDPRSFETQVNRWEFVIRGRTTDALPDTYETPERQAISPQTALTAKRENDLPGNSTQDETEQLVHFLGRLGSKSARPVALFFILLVLTLLVRIISAVMHAGIRLAGLAGGEREYMKRLLDEMLYQRNRPEK